MLFVGDDWAEAHHDIEIEDDQGRVLVRRRLPEGVAGLAALHALVGDHLGEGEEPEQVLVGIETDRGPWVQALIAAGYTVYPINPLQAARYRERHTVSGAKSDPGDAHVLAEIVRLDRAHHRPAAGDSSLAEQVRLAARAHQSMIWMRQRAANTLRSLLREYYPAALAAFSDDLAGRDALAVLAAAPGPAQGAGSPSPGSRVCCARPAASATCMPAPPRSWLRCAASRCPVRAELVEVNAASVSALVAVLTTMVAQTGVLEEQVRLGFGQHPDAEIYLSQPGLGTILAARVLAEMGDDPDRYADARARKNYAGMAPVTRASGTKRVVLARYARNRRLADALYQQAFAALTGSPGARACYDRHRARGATHHQALRALANRLVGILHGCLRHHTPYDEATAWARAPARRLTPSSRGMSRASHAVAVRSRHRGLGSVRLEARSVLVRRLNGRDFVGLGLDLNMRIVCRAVPGLVVCRHGSRESSTRGAAAPCLSSQQDETGEKSRHEHPEKSDSNRDLHSRILRSRLSWWTYAVAHPRGARMCLTPGLARSTSTGHDRLDIVFGDLLRFAD